MAESLHSKAARAMMRQVCEDFGVDPAEVTEVEITGGVATFHRVPIFKDVPAGYQVSVHVDADG